MSKGLKLVHNLLQYNGGQLDCTDFINTSMDEFGKPNQVFNGRSSIVLVYDELLHGLAVSKNGEVVILRSDRMEF
ncbi:MAG: hypothetical protein RID25_23325 [Cyclobacteriaceae bacterium]